MELSSASKWLAYAIFSTVFAREVIVSFLKWREGKGGYIYDVRFGMGEGVAYKLCDCDSYKGFQDPKILQTSYKN